MNGRQRGSTSLKRSVIISWAEGAAEGHGVVKLVMEVSGKDPLSYYSVTNVTSEPSLKVRVTLAPVMSTLLPDPVWTFLKSKYSISN